mgnify:CR=1 FL=1
MIFINKKFEDDLIKLGKLIKEIRSLTGFYAFNEITEFEDRYNRLYNSIDRLIREINDQCSLDFKHLNFYSNSDTIFSSGMSSEELKKEFEDAYDDLEIQIKKVLKRDFDSKIEDTNGSNSSDTVPLSNYDVFISHASEDKESIVKPLVKCLQSYGVKVWYDEFTIKPGDRISMEIRIGLSKSKQGIIVLSKNFINKSEGWPGHELGGLLAKKMNKNSKLIPIWHDVNEEDILEYDPSLMDIKGLNSRELSINEICLEIIEVVRPDIYEDIHRITSFKKMIKKTEPKMMKINEIKQGPIRHKKLPKALTTRINLIYKTLAEVHSGSIEEFIDGFKRDIDPSQEIEIWERIAIQFDAATKERDLSIEKKKEVFELLLKNSLGFDIKDFKFKHLTKKDIYNLSDDLSKLKL